MKFELLVFDWDGTLMDSIARIVASVRGAFADMAFSQPSREHARDVIGLGLEPAMMRLCPDATPNELAHLMERYRHHYLIANQTPTPMFEGAIEVVRGLHAQGYLLGVATGKSRRGLDRAFELSGLGDCFHATRCGDEAFSKPHPEMLEGLMDELGVLPDRTLMIGDTEYDLEMARNAGTRSLGVSYGVHHRDRLELLQPLGCLDRIDQLPAWLDDQALSARKTS